MVHFSTLGLAVLLLSFSSFASVGSVGVQILKDKNKIRCTVDSEPTKWWKDGKEINTTLDNTKYKQEPDDNDANKYCLHFTFTTDDEGNYSCITESDPTTLSKLH